MQRVIRLALAMTFVTAVVVGTAASADAQADDSAGDNIVVLTGRADVRADDRVDNVFIADGPVVIDGTVQDTVVALNGDVIVRGSAQEDVVVLDGRVVIEESGHIGGDVVSRRRPVIREGGRFDGSWERWNASSFRKGIAVGSRVVLWVAFTISSLALGLLLLALAPRAARAVSAATRDSVGAVIGWGLIIAMGLPIAAVLVLLTIVGIPLGLGVLGALGLVYGIGYVTGAWILGRRILAGAHPFVAFLVGWVILRLVVLVPIIGGLVSFAATVVGLGSIAVAIYRARRPAELLVRDGGLPGDDDRRNDEFDAQKELLD